MRPPLTTSMTVPVTTPSSFLDLLDGAPGALVLRALLGQDQPAFLVLLLEDQGLDLVADGDDLVGVDVVLDRQLTRGDDTLGLVADVEQHLVAVDLDDGALDDVAVVEVLDGLVDRGEEVLLGPDVVDRDLRCVRKSGGDRHGLAEFLGWMASCGHARGPVSLPVGLGADGPRRMAGGHRLIASENLLRLRLRQTPAPFQGTQGCPSESNPPRIGRSPSKGPVPRAARCCHCFHGRGWASGWPLGVRLHPAGHLPSAVELVVVGDYLVRQEGLPTSRFRPDGRQRLQIPPAS